MRGRGGPVFVRYEDPPNSMVSHIRISARIPVLRSASGRALAAHLPAATVRPFIMEDLRQAARSSDRRGPRSWPAVQKLLSAVKREGVARVRGYLLNGINAISAPVFDHRGKVDLALTVLGDEGDFDCFRDDTASRALSEAAFDLSRRLGYRPSVCEASAASVQRRLRKPGSRLR